MPNRENPNFDAARYQQILDDCPDDPTPEEYREVTRALHACMGLTDYRVIHLPDGSTVESYTAPGEDNGHLFAEDWAEDIAMASE